MKVQMTIEFELEDDLFFDSKDSDMKAWCFDILLKQDLVLHSNLIGECLVGAGDINVIEVKEGI